MEVHIDSNGGRWCIGKSPNDTIVTPTPGARWVILPLSVESMYPMDREDTGIYSHCAMCGRAVEQDGFIVLEFIDNAWGVRIGCCGGNKSIGPANGFISTVATILTPIIVHGCKTVYNGCTICNRGGKCIDPECKRIMNSGLLNVSPVDDLLEHFYRIQLDIVSPLVLAEECLLCGKPCNRLCRVCRVAAYCNYGCKVRDGHVCTPFIEIWRSAQRIFST